MTTSSRLSLAVLPLLVGALLPAPLAAETYAVEFVGTASSGAAINDLGDVAGYSYEEDDCGSWCLPPQDTVVWIDGQRVVLPEHPIYTGAYVTGINSDGLIAGYVGVPGTTTRAVVWEPVGDAYELVDLGLLPGMDSSDSVGIDEYGRVVGWMSAGGAIPSATAPFMWTEADGLVDLTDDGFPNDIPLAISPGGMVATVGYWYSLDDPTSVTALSSVPRGYYAGSYPAVINDDGEQARFLVTTSSSSLVYPFRYHTDGTWQQMSSVGTGSMSRYGLGSINADGDVTATVSSAAVIAYGPDGTAEGLVSKLSTAYPRSTVDEGGPMNSGGDILAEVMIGRSDRLVRLTPAEACTTDCIKVSRLVVRARFVEDPSDPGHCTMSGAAYNSTRASLTVTDEDGVALPGVTITGRFLDDYWTNEEVSGTTNFRGMLTFNYTGPCGVGAVAFLVDDATLDARTLDKTTGTLSGYSIPR